MYFFIRSPVILSHMHDYNTIFVLGTHKLSKDYLSKIEQSQKDNTITYKNIRLIEKPYHQFILNQLHGVHERDIIIPDHTAEHFLLRVFMDIAPTAGTCPVSIPKASRIPYIKSNQDGSVVAMSHATWTCPLYCDEPDVCHHINKKRTWDLGTLSFKDALTYRFTCEPLVSEIVYISLKKIIDSLKDFQNIIAKQNKLTVNIFTHSKCHGIVGAFKLD
jgi:hypothetical protein